MTNLSDLTAQLVSEGYNLINAQARVCQDTVLKALSSGDLNRNITIKGGVVMRSITGNVRRATQDMDLDFIRYSLSDDSIRTFIRKLNCLDGIHITLTGEIEELSQQEYRGKRVHITLSDDFGNTFKNKIDLGVHKEVQIDQDEYCFDVCLDDEGVSLLVNSKEQIFTEKLRSLLRFGPISTRYKDVFDMAYLSDHVDPTRMQQCIDTYIFQASEMRERNLADVITRIEMTFRNRNYRRNIERASHANWLDIPTDDAMNKILGFLHVL